MTSDGVPVIEFVSKPQFVEAIQWTGDNAQDVLEAIPDKTIHYTDENTISVLAGKDGAQLWVPVPVGHWLVHPPGDLSDVWPVEDSYFREKYDDTGPGDYAIGSDVWPGLSKVIEEMGEALVVLGKIIGAGGVTDYWGGRDLRAEAVEELADVMGTIGYFCEHNFTIEETEELLDRSEMKRDRFNDWHDNGHDPKDKTR